MYQTVQNTGLNTAYNTTTPVTNLGANQMTSGMNPYGTNLPMGTRVVQQPTMADKCLPNRNNLGIGHGTITFRPLEARFNHDKDLIGKMDPYCKFKLGFHRGKSSVAKSQGKNPVWNDVITLKSKGQEFAKVKCKDRDRLSLNDRLGKAQIPLMQIYNTGKSSQWYPLHKGDKITGEILVEISYTPNTY